MYERTTMETKDGKQAPDDNTIELKVRRPYLKPDFSHERVFETRALTCGKLAGTTMQCQSNPNAS
jgi:hypothetical protein